MDPRPSLDRTQALPVLETAEFQRPPRRGPRAAWSLALFATAAVAAALVQRYRAGPAPDPGPRAVRVFAGVRGAVVEFETARPVRAAVELRDHDDQEPPAAVLRSPARATAHRFVVPLTTGVTRRARAVTPGGAALPRTLPPPVPFSFKVAGSPPPPGAPGAVTIKTAPPSTGSAWLEGPDGEAVAGPFELTGPPGAQRLALPAAPPGASASGLRFRGTSADGVAVAGRVGFRWGHPGAVAGLLTRGYVAALRAFDAGLKTPPRSIATAGLLASENTALRPAPARWDATLGPLRALEAWGASAPRPPVRAPAGRALYDAAAHVALVEAAFAGDPGPPIAPLGARAVARALVPCPAPGPGGRPLLGAPTRLYPRGTGMPPGFYGHAATSLTLAFPPDLDPGRDYLVVLECGPLRAEYFFTLAAGGARVWLARPLSEPAAPGVPRPASHRLTARVPGAWLSGPGRLTVSAVAGTMFPEPIPVAALRLVAAPPPADG